MDMGETTAIYYFSATGNSLAVALDLAQKLSAPEPISIPGTFVLHDPYAAAREADRVGFVFPVHRASLPEMVRGFIEQMPKRRDCYCFAIATYTWFGYNEFWDIDEILARDGGMLNYAAGIRTMGNVGLTDPDSKAMEQHLLRIAQKVDEVAEALGNRQENYFHRSSRLLGKVVKAYTDSRRRSLSFRVTERCTKCGICVQVCPARNIQVHPDQPIAPIRSDKCEACYACMHWCPAQAITTLRPLHTHYHHPNIKPEQLNPAKTLREKSDV